MKMLPPILRRSPIPVVSFPPETFSLSLLLASFPSMAVHRTSSASSRRCLLAVPTKIFDVRKRQDRYLQDLSKSADHPRCFCEESSTESRWSTDAVFSLVSRRCVSPSPVHGPTSFYPLNLPSSQIPICSSIDISSSWTRHGHEAKDNRTVGESLEAEASTKTFHE